MKIQIENVNGTRNSENTELFLLKKSLSNDFYSNFVVIWILFIGIVAECGKIGSS